MKKAATCLCSLLLASLCMAAEGGYLFATFKGEGSPMTEQIYFGLSRDGLAWEGLNGGEPVLVSKLGEKGVRDPYLLRAEDGRFYLLATDLSINLNHDWTRAVKGGSRSLVIWESPDLLKWSEPRLVKVASDDAGCTWAPEAVYDAEKKDYLVFWASKTKSDNYAKHRIWAARTKDFKTFGKPFVYLEKSADVIDTTIVRENGHYYRMSKNEMSKGLIYETSEKLDGPWTDVPGFGLTKLTGHEGPAFFQLKPAADGKPGTWGLLLDYYSKGKGYQAYATDNLAGGDFKTHPGVSFPFRFRHGSVLALSETEFARVRKNWPEAKAK